MQHRTGPGMKTFIRYTGAFLLAVFTIPAAYQSIHVLQHHTDIPCSHHCQTGHPEDLASTSHSAAGLPDARGNIFHSDAGDDPAAAAAIKHNAYTEPGNHCDAGDDPATAATIRHHASAESANHCDAGLPAAPEQQPDGYSSQQQERKPCPIVDFRFAVKDLPEHTPFFSMLVIAEALQGVGLTGFHPEAVPSQQNPRAPPVFLNS